MGRYGVGVTKACAVVMISRSLYRYQSCRRDSTGLVMCVHEIAHTRVHYGYRRVHVMLRCQGFRDNHKRVYRLYREQGLSLRHKRPKRNKSAQRRQPKTVAQAINDIWSMDFVMDQLFDRRRLRALTLVDNYSRECLAIDIGQSLRGDNPTRTPSSSASIEPIGPRCSTPICSPRCNRFKPLPTDGWSTITNTVRMKRWVASRRCSTYLG